MLFFKEIHFLKDDEYNEKQSFIFAALNALTLLIGLDQRLNHQYLQCLKTKLLLPFGKVDFGDWRKTEGASGKTSRGLCKLNHRFNTSSLFTSN